MRRMAFMIAVVSLAAGSFVAIPTEAHHSNNHHSGYLYGPWSAFELNGRTTLGNAVRIRQVTSNPDWSAALTTAVANWNSGAASTFGFNVFQENPTADVTLHADSSQQCSMNSHGCVKFWTPNLPTGEIHHLVSVFTAANTQEHRVSDLMHEMGHVLYHAGEHYPDYNCTSIMGHSARENSSSAPGFAGWCGAGNVVNGAGESIKTAVMVPHDTGDIVAAYSANDTQDAVYLNFANSSSLRHYFEGGYLGGNGRAVHQEWENVIDRSSSTADALGGTYAFYASTSRKIDNEDDATPENTASISGVPAVGYEWCFKSRGHSRLSWGPYSKRYCVARVNVGNGVWVTSDRNSQAHFRVWNYSGGTLANVQLRTSPAPGTMKCQWLNVPNNTSTSTCSVTVSGAGAYDVWISSYVPLDTIGFDSN